MITLINAKMLRDALNTAATKDIRYYLNGVFVEVTPGFTRIISTDGQVMSIQGHKNDHSGDKFTVLIPNDTIKALDKKMRAYELKNEGSTWIIHNQIFTPMDGRFPDWRRILPDLSTMRHDAEIAHQFQPDNIAKFAKIAGKETLVIENASTSVVRILGRSDFIGVLMSLRPEWIEKHDTSIIDKNLWASY